MTPAAFAKLALAQPGAAQGTHGGHPDFRAGGKVFASLGFPDRSKGVVKLTPEQQDMLVAAEPGIFTPVNGLWGRRGYTTVDLAAADTRTMRSALAMAVQNVTAPRPTAGKARRRVA